MPVLHLAHHIYADRVMCGHLIGTHTITPNVEHVTCKKCKETVAYEIAMGGEH